MKHLGLLNTGKFFCKCGATVANGDRCTHFDSPVPDDEAKAFEAQRRWRIGLAILVGVLIVTGIFSIAAIK